VNQEPLVSIIIPTFNRAHLIGETLDSVLAQTYTNWECIVVDDFSTDTTSAKILEYQKTDSRFCYVPNGRVKGGQGARNTGLEKSKGEWLIFLDSDDLLDRHCLEKRISFCNLNPEMDFLVFQSVLFNSRPGDLDKVPNLFYKKMDDLSRFIVYDYPWNISSPILKRDFLVRHSIKWNEKLILHQDLDFYIFLLTHTPSYKKRISYPDVFIRSQGEDKLSLQGYTPEKNFGKYNYLESVFNSLKTKKLVFKHKKQLYGLALSYMLLFVRQSEYKHYLKVPGLFFKNSLYTSALTLVFDQCYISLRGKIYNKVFRKVLDLYTFFNFENRTQYLTPKGSTLGKVTVEQHLLNTTAL